MQRTRQGRRRRDRVLACMRSDVSGTPDRAAWRRLITGRTRLPGDIRTFAIITTDANELVADIHDRMPIILSRYDYARWLSEEPDPHDLMRPFPSELMRIWPISTRVNKSENDDPSILDPIDVSIDAV
jgi:putative SOS response-associated peptidase YedK